MLQCVAAAAVTAAVRVVVAAAAVTAAVRVVTVRVVTAALDCRLDMHRKGGGSLRKWLLSCQRSRNNPGNSGTGTQRCAGVGCLSFKMSIQRPARRRHHRHDGNISRWRCCAASCCRRSWCGSRRRAENRIHRPRSLQNGRRFRMISGTTTQ